MNGVSATIAIDGVLIACLLLAVLLLLLALFDGGRRADEAMAQFDEPLPEYELDVPVDYWPDTSVMNLVDALQIAEITTHLQESTADELALRRAAKR